MYKLPGSPSSLGGILDDGFKLFKETWKKLLAVAVVASILSTIPQLMIEGLKGIKPAQQPGLPAIGVGAVLTIFVMILLSLVAYSVLLAGTHQAAQSESVSLGSAVRTGLARAPALLGAYILGGLAIMVGLILLIIPGLWLMIALFPAFLVPVVERLGPAASLSRGYRLVKGSWWRTAGILTVMFLIVAALVYALQIVSALVVLPFMSSGNPSQLMTTAGLLAAVLTAPLLPLGYCLMYAVYTDLRLRKDGGDLLSRAAAAGA
jgi:hypothetical protein